MSDEKREYTEEEKQRTKEMMERSRPLAIILQGVCADEPANVAMVALVRVLGTFRINGQLIGAEMVKALVDDLFAIREG